MVRLGLTNASVVHDRIEALEGAGFDLATSRALGPVLETLGASLGIVRAGGRLVLYKGPRWGDERAQAAEVVARAGGRIASETDVRLPGLDRTTTLVSIERTGG
jgi:16S rRNA G527 N7-methylase RsmG